VAQAAEVNIRMAQFEMPQGMSWQVKKMFNLWKEALKSSLISDCGDCFFLHKTLGKDTVQGYDNAVMG